MAAVERAVREAQGEWKGGFSLKLGKCTTYRAELWGVHKRLKLAWDLRYRRIDLQFDNMMMVQAIKASSPPLCSNLDLIQTIQ